MSDQNANRGRRVTDSNDPVEVTAIRVERLHHRQELLETQVKLSIEQLRQSVDGLQHEFRRTTEKINEVAGLHHLQEANTNSITLINSQLQGLGTKLDNWSNDFEKDQDRKWSKYEQNRDAWRIDHEKDNNKTKNDIIFYSGIAYGLFLTAGTIISMFLWNLHDSFDGIKTQQLEQMSHITYNRDEIDKLKDGQTDIKLYLASGGAIPLPIPKAPAKGKP